MKLFTIISQVNKTFRKFERKYRDHIKGTETRLRHRHAMKCQHNIMGTSIYHNMSVSQSCLYSLLCNPYISFKISLFTCLQSFFLDLGTHFAILQVYLVANVLANALYISFKLNLLYRK